MKKILSIILAAAVCAALTACTPGNENPEDGRFLAKVLEANWDTALVEPLEGEPERNSCDQITFSTRDLEQIGAHEGSIVEITYDGNIMETYPAKINATGWNFAKEARHIEFTAQWLGTDTAEKCDDDVFDHVIIKEIYANCFFVESVVPWYFQIKLNGQLSEDWCVGDQVLCTYENTRWDNTSHRIEADVLTVEPSDFQMEPGLAAKPVIYLYPETETNVSVKVRLDGKLTCTYPDYGSGWQVTAKPDGTLTDSKGQTYNYLYWEGETDTRWDLSKGFCVKGEDTAAFLEDALEKLGLNRREANEFIVYWLPLMQENPYNIIAFQTDRYTDAAKLEITPAPDTLIRVFMAWQGSETPVDIPAQELTAPVRTGFTVVEWGGTEQK